MNKILLGLFIFIFLCGQFARVQLGNGITILGLDVVVFCISFFWIIRNAFRRGVIHSLYLMPIGIFSIIAVFSLLLNSSWLSGSELLVSGLYLVRFLAYVGLYFFLRELSKTEWGWFVKGLILSILGIVAIGFLQYVYYPHLGNLFYLGWDEHLYRLFSVFLDPNFAGALYVLFLFFVIGVCLKTQHRRSFQSIFLWVLSACIFISIFLTYSRTALLMLIGGGLLSLVLLKKYKIIIVFLLCTIVLLFTTVNTKIEGLNPFRTVSTQARIVSYEIATDIIKKHPVFGVGFNAYRYAQNEYGYRVDGNWQVSHADSGTDNSFLFVLATTGVVGFTAYIFMWYRILNTVGKSSSQINVDAHVAFISIISAFIGSFFINVLFYPFIMAWLWILVARVEKS